MGNLTLHCVTAGVPEGGVSPSSWEAAQDSKNAGNVLYITAACSLPSVVM